MVKQSEGSMVTISRDEIIELCQKLGHDPGRVARIIIEPHVVTVEYEHPVSGADPSDTAAETRHPMVNRE